MADVVPEEGAFVAAIRAPSRPYRAAIDVPRIGQNFRVAVENPSVANVGPFRGHVVFFFLPE